MQQEQKKEDFQTNVCFPFLITLELSAGKLQVLWTDMPQDKQEQVLTLANKFYEEVLDTMKDQFAERLERRIADYFKEEFDRLYGPSWHCLCGQFAAYVTHETKTLCHFEMQFMPTEKKAHHHKHPSESVPESKRNAPPVRYWKVLLFKAC